MTDRTGTMRMLLFGVLALGVVGLGGELVLLEHWESPVQWVPLLGLVAAIPLTWNAAFRPSRGSLRAFRVLMVLFVVAGATGLFFHGRGNALLELEMNPTASTGRLVTRILFGGTPLLAPGALAQLGLIGLVAALGQRDERTAT